MEKTVKVTGIKPATKKDGTPVKGKSVTFMEISTQKEETKMIFDDADIANCKTSLDNNATMNVTIEKKGDFWNVTKVVPFTSSTVQSPPVAPSPAIMKQAEEALNAPNKPPEAKSGSYDSVKNRSVSLSYACDLAVADKIKVTEIIMKANEFVLFMESGRI